MEKLYQEYRDIAEFRIVYIKEAHPADGFWSVRYAREMGIDQPVTHGERCSVASALLDDKKLTIPCVVDNPDNAVNKAYKAYPDRVYLVDLEGRVGVAGGRGPFGFKPGLVKVRKWLMEYRAGLPSSPAPE